MTKAFIVTLILLVLSSSWIVYREVSLQALAGDSRVEARLYAEMELRNKAAQDELKIEHQSELATIQYELNAAVANAETAKIDLERKLNSKRKQIIKQARKSKPALKQAVVNVSGADENQVDIDETHVRLTHNAAIGWIDLTLKLKHGLQVSDKICDEKLAKLRLEIVPPAVVARQAFEADRLNLSGEISILKARNNNLKMRLMAADGGVLKWSLISGFVGLAVGGCSGVLAYHYGK